MATLYGGRWRVVKESKSLGRGGQAEIFRVVDQSNEFQGEYALKRVINHKRHARFRAEIEAIKRIDHPNIIRLLDHSQFDFENESDEKQYIVMPIAEGGNLAATSTLSICEGNCEVVLKIAMQIASGISAAHEQGVIHRDLKPENVLRAGDGLEVWVTDFGICHLKDAPRTTEIGEVVGPRTFIAPELEAGGQADVTQAADVYSLGKLIYFLYTGGVELPRERLYEPEFKRMFDGGERRHLLLLMLSKMICAREHRLSDMNEVQREITKILDWENRAVSVAMHQSDRDRLQKLEASIVKTQIERAQAIETARSRDESLELIVSGFIELIQSELRKIASVIQTGGVLQAQVGVVTSQATLPRSRAPIEIGGFRAIKGVEIRLRNPAAMIPATHTAQILICRGKDQLGLNGSLVSNPSSTLNLSVLPIFCHEMENSYPTRAPRRYVFDVGENKLIERPADVVRLAVPHMARPLSAMQPKIKILMLQFNGADWPSIVEKIVEHVLPDTIRIVMDLLEGRRQHLF